MLSLNKKTNFLTHAVEAVIAELQNDTLIFTIKHENISQNLTVFPSSVDAININALRCRISYSTFDGNIF